MSYSNFKQFLSFFKFTLLNIISLTHIAHLFIRYVFSAPSHILDDIPGTLMLTDCLEQCQANDTCRAVNYETGLCVLFSSDADQLPGGFYQVTSEVCIYIFF